MVVSMWVSGKRPIPKVRHQALVLFVSSLTRITWAHERQGACAETAHALRADLLFQAIDPLLDLATRNAASRLRKRTKISRRCWIPARTNDLAAAW